MILSQVIAVSESAAMSFSEIIASKPFTGALFFLSLAGVFGALGGTAAGFRSPTRNEIILPGTGRSLLLGVLGDAFVGAITGMAVMFVATALINIDLADMKTPGHFLRFIALGILSGFAGMKFLGDMSERLQGQVQEIREQVATNRALVDALREATFLRSAKKYAEALVFYERALKEDPKNEEALIGQAVATSFIDEPKKYAEALDLLDKALVVHPKSAKAFYNRACLRHLCGTYQNSDIIDDLTQAVKNDELYRVFAKHDEDLSALSQDPEFRRVLRA